MAIEKRKRCLELGLRTWRPESRSLLLLTGLTVVITYSFISWDPSMACLPLGHSLLAIGVRRLPPSGGNELSSYGDTTGPGIPLAVRQMLDGRFGPIDEDADTFYGAGEAVAKLEAECGWDPVRSTFAKGPNCVRDIIGVKPGGPNVDPLRNIEAEVHIVVPTIRHLQFLEKWRDILYKYDFIFIQDGDPDVELEVPSWVSYQLFNRRDIERAIGDRSWIISSGDASIRNFGFLVSNRTYVYTLDDDCLPANDTSGRAVNAISEHLRNLLSPSTPYFFNTLYDPYADGNDFVRGYPYSLRNGVPTAMSHGIWLNAPDYDAPTQLLKVGERNHRHYAGLTQTIPHGVLYPMCSMNVAFNRELIGPAFMQGLMGERQPWARYDDMFAGWASKVCADHLGYGVKSGAPYIYHNKASNPFTNLKKEYKGLFWQEDLIRFFHTKAPAALRAQAATDAQQCYKVLSAAIREEFSGLHPYFTRLAEAMSTWVDLWREAGKGKIVFQPSRTGNPVRARVAVFTVVRNEAFYLPLWLSYMRKHFDDADISILDNDSDDGSTQGLPVEIKRIHNDAYFDHSWLIEQVQKHTQELLNRGYTHVLFAEVDELILPNPAKYRGLAHYFSTMDLSREITRVVAYDLFHDYKSGEPPFDPARPILAQRKYWIRVPMYDKPLLVKKVVQWQSGFHTCTEGGWQDQDLYLVHLHKMDHDFLIERHEWKAKQAFKESDVKQNMGVQHRMSGTKLEEYFMDNADKKEEVPRTFSEPTVLF